MNSIEANQNKPEDLSVALCNIGDALVEFRKEYKVRNFWNQLREILEVELGQYDQPIIELVQEGIKRLKQDIKANPNAQDKKLGILFTFIKNLIRKHTSEGRKTQALIHLEKEIDNFKELYKTITKIDLENCSTTRGDEVGKGDPLYSGRGGYHSHKRALS